MHETIDVGRNRPVLDRLVEQLLIRCDHAQEARTLSIVTPWPWSAAGADFAFARFAFEGVRDFRVLARTGDEAGDLTDERSLVIAESFVPDSLRGSRALGLAFHGGRHVAGIAFGYETVSATVRHARCIDEHRYFDLASGEEIPWQDPFAERR